MQENNSLNARLIIKRLKKRLKIKTDIELSSILNIKPNTISTWKKRNSLDFSSIITICDLYEIDLNEIFLGKEELKRDTAENKENTILVSREMQFQYVIGNNPNFLEELPRYSFPFIENHESRAFQIIGNNMYPTLEENSYAVCQKRNINEIINNKIYIIINREKGLFINRIKLDSNYSKKIKLIHDNKPMYNEIEMNLSEIDELWEVKASISYDVNNTNQLKDIKNKINTVENYLLKNKKNIY